MQIQLKLQGAHCEYKNEVSLLQTAKISYYNAWTIQPPGVVYWISLRRTAALLLALKMLKVETFESYTKCQVTITLEYRKT